MCSPSGLCATLAAMADARNVNTYLSIYPGWSRFFCIHPSGSPRAGIPLSPSLLIRRSPVEIFSFSSPFPGRPGAAPPAALARAARHRADRAAAHVPIPPRHAVAPPAMAGRMHAGAWAAAAAVAALLLARPPAAAARVQVRHVCRRALMAGKEAGNDGGGCRRVPCGGATAPPGGDLGARSDGGSVQSSCMCLVARTRMR